MTGSARIIRGNALALPLADDSVDLVVTSPPYFGLRSYQDGGEHYAGQIGDEPTPAEFVDALIAATAEMVRVLKPSGSIWVNLGDKYASGGRTSYDRTDINGERGGASRPQDGARPKSLLGIPWRYAIRCIDDLGLILRAEVIWSKPNGLPESVTDRVRRSHEQWFHFTLNPRYYSAVDEVREAHAPAGLARRAYAFNVNDAQRAGNNPVLNGEGERPANPLGKLPSSVWEINEEESLVRCVLSAIHAGSLTIDEGERLLKGQAWTGAHDSGSRSTSPATAGSGRQDARPRDTASSGSTAGQSSHTESPSSSATDPSPMGSSSTTSAASGIASGTSSPSLSATTSCAGQAPSPPSTQPRPTAATGTSSRTPTPTDPQTEAACAESACEQRTDAPTGERSAPQPDAPGSVWTIPTQPLTVPAHLGIDHFAAFPTEWPRRIITGWSPRGVCVECGEGRRPIRGRTDDTTGAPDADAAKVFRRQDEITLDDLRRLGKNGLRRTYDLRNAGHARNFGGEHRDRLGERVLETFGGWAERVVGMATQLHTLDGTEACACPEPTAPTTPGVVLDPFGGTGTTALVAHALGRHGISVDMSADYCRLAEWRTTDPDQIARAMQVDKPARQVDGQADLFDYLEETP